ncbi:MAG: hypothetical protein OSJ44_16630, partial [Lachnospiraceae bacterium]|nr:hypothetical protein [Lachnospiraceae bacterium]
MTDSNDSPTTNWQNRFPNQKPRCKQRGIKLAALQSSGVFAPKGHLPSRHSSNIHANMAIFLIA